MKLLIFWGMMALLAGAIIGLALAVDNSKFTSVAICSGSAGHGHITGPCDGIRADSTLVDVRQLTPAETAAWLQEWQ